jgi:homopolymeric O-antigen transport system permease protein
MSETSALPRSIVGEDQNLWSYLKSAYEHRRMIWLAADKFIRDTYNRTVFGIWWIIVRAVTPTIAIVLVLQHVDVLQTPGLPYPLYATSGMLLWTPFHIGVRKGMRALTQMAKLTRQFAFPHINVMLAANALAFVYFSIFAIFLSLVLIYYAIMGHGYAVVGPDLLLVPAVLVLFFVFISGVLSILSVLFVVSRDIRFAMPVFLQLWFLATPVVYDLSLLPEGWRTAVLLLNPLANMVVSLRFGLFQIGEWNPLYFGVTIAEVLLTFLVGAWFMMRAERALKIVL